MFQFDAHSVFFIKLLHMEPTNEHDPRNHIKDRTIFHLKREL